MKTLFDAYSLRSYTSFHFCACSLFLENMMDEAKE